jgi:hypothetical protein
VFVLKMTDGNNNNVPIAFGMYHSESEDNYSHFLSAVMEVLGSTRDGVVGRQLNHTDTVIATDRAKGIIAALRASVPDYYKKEGYARGYDKGTCRLIMTCVLDDDTLPPPMEPNPRGQKRKSRFKSLMEGGFRKKRPPNPVAQTKKNMNNTMDDALLAEQEKPAIVLRQLRGTGYGFGHGQPEDMSLLDSVADLIGSALISTGNAFKTRQGRQG